MGIQALQTWATSTPKTSFLCRPVPNYSWFCWALLAQHMSDRCRFRLVEHVIEACTHSCLPMQDEGSAGDSRQVLIDQAGENPCSSLVPHFMHTAQVKSHQKASAAFQKAWHAYCDEHGDGIYDPARHGIRFLIITVREFDMRVRDLRGTRSNCWRSF